MHNDQPKYFIMIKKNVILRSAKHNDALKVKTCFFYSSFLLSCQLLQECRLSEISHVSPTTTISFS